MKKIEVQILVNGNDDGAKITFSDEDAAKLTILWQEALATILKDVDEEDYWSEFDPWLKENSPYLYDKILKGFYEDFAERMGEGIDNEDEWKLYNKYVSLDRDANGIHMSEDNDVVINQVYLPK